MLTRAAPGGATYFMLVGDAGDGHGGAARGVHERSRDNGASDVTNVQVPASVRGLDALVCEECKQTYRRRFALGQLTVDASSPFF